MVSPSLRFRHKQELTETGKRDGQPQREETLIKNSRERMISDLNLKPSGQGLNTADGPLSVVHGSINEQRKRKLNKIRRVKMDEINIDPTFKDKSSTYKLALSVSLPGCNSKNNEACNQGDTSSSPQKANEDSAPESELDKMILMSCLKCYLHVLVCHTDPKCPKWGKGDGLLDMFRENPMKKAKIV